MKVIPNTNHEYEATECGKIYSNKRNKFLKPQLCLGYQKVGICLNGKLKLQSVHRLVMEAYYGKSNLHVNHIDGNKTNNNLSNLEYVTALQNQRHAWKTGLKKRRLNTNKILKQYNLGTMIKDIAKLEMCSTEAIRLTLRKNGIKRK